MGLLRNLSRSIVARTSSGDRPAARQGDGGTRTAGGIVVYRPKKAVADYLGYEAMFEDGLCRIEQNLYSVMLEFSDISYQDARYEEQLEVLGSYSEFVNSFEAGIGMSLVLADQRMKDEVVRETMFLETEENPEHERDNLYRREINNMIAAKVLASAQNIDRKKYLVLSCVAEDKDDARGQLFRSAESSVRKFEDIGSDMRMLNGKERLAAIASITRPDDGLRASEVDYEDLRQNPLLSTRDLVAPYCFDKVSGEVLKFGDYYGQVLTVTKYARTVKDEVLAQFLGLQVNQVIAMHIQAIEQAAALEFIEMQLGDMQTEKTALMRKGNQRFFYTDEMLPPRLADGIENAKNLRDDVMSSDQKMFKQTMLFFTYAKSLEELDGNIKEITRVARTYQYKIDPVKNMQRSRGFSSVLPIGRNRVPVERQITTSPLANFTPFTSEELMQPGGAYYGQNQLSKNPIFFNRKSLDAPNGAIIGKPGKGKSFASKQEITNTLLCDKTASVDVIDPEREYSSLADGFDGEIIRIAANSKTYINPFDITEDYSDEDDPLLVKTEFILSLMDMMAGGLTAMQESIVDRVCRIAYEPYFESLSDKDIPILSDFCNELRSQPEADAQDLAVTIERFVSGSYSVFNHHTNIDTSKRLVIWDLKDLAKNLRSVGLLVVLDQVWNRIVRNREKGRRSYFYTDEWQLLLKNEHAVDFYDELWSRARKWGAVPTIITQNIARVLKNEKARLMISNSDFLMILSQSANDAQELRGLLHLSDAQMRHISSQRKGAGLIVADTKIIPFVNEFPEDTELYRMFTTKFDDLVEMRQRVVGYEGTA